MTRRDWLITGLCVALLSAYTVYHHITFMEHQGGLAWYERVQWERTLAVMHGEQGTPWQYRLFTDGMVYGTVRTFEALGVPRPIGSAFVLIRLLQNALMFSLAIAWYRALGSSLPAALFGIALLSWGMGHGLYDTDLTFNTYTDMSLFLGAALLFHFRRDAWLVPLMIVASFNRETSGCIPFMLLFARWQGHGPDVAGPYPRWQWHRPFAPRETWILFGVCLALWLFIVGGMRLPFVFGVRPYIVPTAGAAPPIDLLVFNLTWWRTWVFLFATLGLLPLIAFAQYRHWPPLLQRICWAVVPVWFPVHFIFAHAPETRLFFVPQVLVFVPGALAALAYGRMKSGQSERS